MTSKTTASLLAICVACAASAIAGTALAQTAETPPAQAGAGAAAAVSGDAQQQPAAEAPAEEEDETPAVAATDGKLVLPNGQDITPDHMENGRWYTAEDIPTYKIAEDGAVDWATFSGYRRYSAECHVCHGPDGEGSTYAPALRKSVLTMGYYDFLEIAASGKQEVNTAANLVMPAFGTNKNVWCYIDDIYAYLLARGTGDLPRGRPAKREDKSDEFVAQEDSCMSG
ncbi:MULTISPECIES: c-type cytochrome, methanol metabolism-related [Paracoccus]|jgi:methanol metabolism-related c-type cytochrome|uniref:c-type cytochrome, methanol metabolism-related n=1 Tax=Paracoccus TaxID=265 RepID=UPI001E58570A|nr:MULTISPECIES: c-type cytochrome, methanol metabolism-related [Paracoccus]UFS66126.1 c-type cytochrome, methanol metabolism-related [Paracoccus denitrificans]